MFISGYANTENIFYCLSNHKNCRLVELLIIKFVSTWLPSQAIDNSKKPLSQGFSHFKKNSPVPHSRNIYKGNEVKFSAQRFLGSLERTSVSYDWPILFKATINQSEDTIFHPNDPRNRCLKFELILLIVFGDGEFLVIQK